MNKRTLYITQAAVIAASMLYWYLYSSISALDRYNFGLPKHLLCFPILHLPPYPVLR